MFTECIQEKVHPATWAVVGLKKDLMGLVGGHRGTAFAVDTYGHLLTCWHVTFMDQDTTEDVEFFEVLQPEIDRTRRFRAKLVARDKDRDLALLKIEDEAYRTTAVQLNAGESVPWGRSCCAFGHPLSVASENGIRIFTRAAAGVLSMPYTSSRFAGCRIVRLYEIDFFTHGGLSGGPLFLPNGCVFGIVSGSLMLNQDGGGQAVRSNLSVAIDVAEAIEFLHPLNVKLQLAGRVDRNIVAVKAKHRNSPKKQRRRR